MTQVGRRSRFAQRGNHRRVIELFGLQAQDIIYEIVGLVG